MDSSTFARPPDPGTVRRLEDLAIQLRQLRAWAGSPSYAVIARRVNDAWRAAGRPAAEATAKNTVADCFRVRPRPNVDLVLAIVEALNPDPAYLTGWRQALRVVHGEATAATYVAATDRLPADLPSFVGRAAELRELMVGAAITAIDGMPGVGKTALAVRAAHTLARTEPFDRTLYVDLRGVHPDPALPPVDSAAVLSEFLRLLGMPGDEVLSLNPEQRRSAYQRLLRARRVLVVLDNAADEAQAEPLIADGTPGRILVTSRRALDGLPKGRRLFLDVFAPEEAVALLREAAGEQRYAADPRAAQHIASLLGHLPLAVAVSASRIRNLAWPLAEHLERLRTRHGLHVEDQVQRAVDLSYADLSAVSRRMFRLLALHPGPDLDAYAAAAMSDMDIRSAEGHLHTLIVANLLQQPQPGRLVFHDVIRTYSLARAFDEDSSSGRRAALTRLFDQYRRTATAAAELVTPEGAAAGPSDGVPAMDTQTAAAWLDRELPNLLATAMYAVDSWPDHTTGLSEILMRYLDDRGRIADAETLHTAAVRAATVQADRGGECRALINLSILLFRQGRLREAAARLRMALPIAQETGDRQSLGRILANLGAAYQMLGRLPEALDQHRQALTIATEIGNRSAVGRTVGNLGTVYGKLGQYAEALNHHQRALAIFQELGDRVSEGRELANLGVIAERTGDYALALQRHHQAKAIFDEIGYQLGTAYALAYLGTDYLGLQDYPAALDHQRQALAIAAEAGDRELEASTHNDLGDTLLRMDRLDDALDHRRSALEMASRTGDGFEQGRAHAGIGDILAGQGDPDRAREEWTLALALFDEIGVPEADEVRAKL